MTEANQEAYEQKEGSVEGLHGRFFFVTIAEGVMVYIACDE